MIIPFRFCNTQLKKCMHIDETQMNFGQLNPLCHKNECEFCVYTRRFRIYSIYRQMNITPNNPQLKPIIPYKKNSPIENIPV